MLNFYNNDPSFLKYSFKVLMNDLALLLDPVTKLRRDQVIDMHGDFCLVFTASPKWRVELRAKIDHYRNRCFISVTMFDSDVASPK